MIVIVDAYAWVEYLDGSEKGKVAAKIIDNEKNTIVTLESTLSEIYYWGLLKNKNSDEIINFLESNSKIISIKLNDWIDAAKLKIEARKKIKDFGILNALILAKQKEINCHILTGDSHFRGMKKVVYV